MNARGHRDAATFANASIGPLRCRPCQAFDS